MSDTLMSKIERALERYARDTTAKRSVTLPGAAA